MPFDGHGLGALLLVGYSLVQLPVVLYLARYLELGDGESAPGPVDGYAFHDSSDGDDGDDSPSSRVAAAGTCDRCGAANDAGYRYCRVCVSRLT